MDLLGIVLINYNSEIETVKYIKNELSHVKCNSKIAIVNNSNSDKKDINLDLLRNRKIDWLILSVTLLTNHP